ncbi:SGNH/GDSL hydrolase family protein [Streptomyces tsukubensis]|uniref:triacylglycerol lipase n=1 Tax=Streptomyces tsukubensis TaxID=83656 RepID=A0A1V4AFS5_9ACTN|nr:SGNH/GDSL hydrolase family protein [Streptomyces tsukubensis]OON82441.1 lipase [Streptomyces tsukubensis]QFR92835.1 lipase [Streptomyces tsukubensis]
MRFSRFTAYASSLLLAATVALTGAGVARADQQTAPDSYVALGDSYSSGVGSGAYDSASGACKRSSRAYPALWAAAHSAVKFDFTACAGARTGDVLANQLAPLGSGTGLVSLTIGGNDADFAGVMKTCVLKSEASCVQRVETARVYVDSTLPAQLDKVYTAISDKAPRARVVVLGYPRFYKLNGSCVEGLTEKERTAVNEAADHINRVIAKRAADHGFGYGDVSAAFAGHELCSGDSWLHSVDWLHTSESYHPKAIGQSGGYLPVLTKSA